MPMMLLGSRRSIPAKCVLLCVLLQTWQHSASAQQPLRPAISGPTAAERTIPDAPAPRTSNAPVPPARLGLAERLHIYEHSITNVDSLLDPAFAAAVNQARNEPPEWGQGATGYADRFASGYGRVLISRTIRFGVAALDHEDPRFHPSNETGFLQRVESATFHVFVVPTDRGSQIPAFSRFAGIYGAAFISNAWYPTSRANTTHALLRGTTALSATVGWNVFREFWPDIKDHLSGRRYR